MKKKLILIAIVALFTVNVWGQVVDATYLNPKNITNDVYKFIRFGDLSEYYAGFMYNISSTSGYGNGNDFSIFTYDNRDLTFKTGTGNVIFFPSSGGNVGIGTTSPDELLEVSSSTGTATINPTTIKITSTSSASDWNLLNSWGNLDFHSDDASGVAGVKGRIGILMGNTAGSLTDINFSTFNGLKIVERMRITGAGNVGIGTTSPTAKLHVAGTFLLDDPNTVSDWNNIWQSGFFQGYNMPNSPETGQWFWGINMGHSSNSSTYRYGGQILIKNSYTNPNMYFRSINKDGEGTWAKVLNNQGDQQINGNLIVDGIVTTEEVRVEIINGADFVFEDNYQLRKLEELEEFVKTNKHLPEIASEKEMQENGVDMSEFQIQLLQKIEELTLYVIELKKENDELKEKVEGIISKE